MSGVFSPALWKGSMADACCCLVYWTDPKSVFWATPAFGLRRHLCEKGIYWVSAPLFVEQSGIFPWQKYKKMNEFTQWAFITGVLLPFLCQACIIALYSNVSFLHVEHMASLVPLLQNHLLIHSHGDLTAVAFHTFQKEHENGSHVKCWRSSNTLLFFFLIFSFPLWGKRK